MGANLLSPNDQFILHTAGMTEKEVIALKLLSALESREKPSSISMYQDLQYKAEFIFFNNLLAYQARYKQDAVKAFEDLIDRLSLPFAGLIADLDLGTLSAGPSLQPINRLPVNFGKLKNLKKLYMFGHRIEDFGPLAPLEMNFLCAMGCPTEDITPINMSSIRWINIAHTRLKDLSHIANSPLIGMQDASGLVIDEDQIQNILSMPNLTSFLWSNGREQYGLFQKNKNTYQYDITDLLEKEKRKKVFR